LAIRQRLQTLVVKARRVLPFRAEIVDLRKILQSEYAADKVLQREVKKYDEQIAIKTRLRSTNPRGWNPFPGRTVMASWDDEIQVN
jgi:hypothetical protein